MQLLLCQLGDALVIILSPEGFTQGETLSEVLYEITLSPLEEELRDMDTKLRLMGRQGGVRHNLDC